MDKAKKKRIKKYISWISMALVVALLAAMPLLARKEAEADGPVASVLSATVEEGSIQTALHGGGTLDPHNIEEVKVPGGVKIKEFLVKNGQMVEEGAPLAVVDKVSVMTAITEVSETMEFLREELEDAKDETVSSKITASAGGRVKKIFAQKGESVQEVMLRDGALAVLSLDGMMAVKLEKQLPLITGEAVSVTLADGETVTGRVESNLDGVTVITVEDEGYEIGQTVTVAQDDQTLGEGSLYIHNAWKATAFSGTIETVNAREEKTLSAGATVFTLKDRDYEGELRRRADQHREYEELLQELFQMYEAGVILAPCAGEVEGVDEDSTHLLSAAPEGWVIAPLDSASPETGEKGWTVLLLSGEVIDSPTGGPGPDPQSSPSCDGTKGCKLTREQHPDGAECLSLCEYCRHKVHDANCLSKCTGLPGCPNADGVLNHKPGCQSLCTGKAGCLAPKARHKSDCPEKCTNNEKCISTRPAAEHDSACIIHCVKDTDGSDGYQCKDTHAHYDICIGRCDGTKNCKAINHKQNCHFYGVSYTACVGIVKEVSGGTIKYKYAAEFSQVTANRDVGGKYTITVKPDFAIMNKEGFVNSGTPCNPGDVILIITGVNAANVTVLENQVYVYQPGAFSMPSFSMPSFDLSAMLGGFMGFGNYGVTAPEEENLFDLEGDTLMTITPHDSATLLISVDEHDIAKVYKGMTGTAKVEALKGAEFPAEVTNIAIAGTNNGGSSKFAVEVSMPMTEEMLSGMSVSVVLPLEEKRVIRIPAAALVQEGARTLVYTALDEEGQPASPVDVEVGITDGEYVQITSDNLQVGQKVYYSYYDTLELDTTAESDRYTLY